MRKLKRQEGFTLIEIIAVLILLGVLAAVAVPKYTSMIDEAKKASAKGALAAGMSAASMGYASALLKVGDTPTGEQTNGNIVSPGGDFSFTFANSGDDIVITTALTSDGDASTTGTWVAP